MNLVIVESPTKAKTLNKFLGAEFRVAASMGHIRDLPSKRLSIDVKNDFEPTYELSEGKGRVVKELQDLAKKSDIVYLAMDPDREGEAIAWHVKYVLAKSKKQRAKGGVFKRITFHQITRAVVEEAIQHAGRINMQLVEAQQARRVLDRLVGYTLSPVLWKKVRRGLSAGRVQSVALRLIVEREKEIEAFESKEYWEVAVKVARMKNKELGIKEGEGFWVSLVEVNGKAVVKGKGDERSFLLGSDKAVAPVVADLKKAKYEVELVEKRERRSRPRPPYTTSTLQQAAANRLGWTAKRTMQVAQSLYEKGLITYHRTDSMHLAPEAVKAVRAVIQEKYGDRYLPEKLRFYKTTSKSAQEAHEAIRPTDAAVSPREVDGGVRVADKKLYDLIWKRFVSCQMADSIFDSTKVEVEATRNKKRETRKYLLRAVGAVTKFDGWKKVYSKKSKSILGSAAGATRPRDLVQEVELPVVVEKEELKYVDLLSEQKFTQPPARFNDASLVKMLEQLGIGRPSTYAPTISTLIGRGYMEREERRFKPTVVGTTVTDFLAKNFGEIMDYGFTAGMEDDLDKIAEGKRKWVPVIDDFWKPFKKKVDLVEEKAKRVKVPVEKTGKKCPECGRKEGGEQVIRTGRYGKFLSCSRFPECRWTGKLEEKIRGVKCEKCKRGDVVVKKTRKGKIFYGCNRYPECDWASWTDPRKSGSKK